MPERPKPRTRQWRLIGGSGCRRGAREARRTKTFRHGSAPPTARIGKRGVENLKRAQTPLDGVAGEVGAAAEGGAPGGRRAGRPSGVGWKEACWFVRASCSACTERSPASTAAHRHYPDTARACERLRSRKTDQGRLSETGCHVRYQHHDLAFLFGWQGDLAGAVMGAQFPGCFNLA